MEVQNIFTISHSINTYLGLIMEYLSMLHQYSVSIDTSRQSINPKEDPCWFIVGKYDECTSTMKTITLKACNDTFTFTHTHTVLELDVLVHS